MSRRPQRRRNGRPHRRPHGRPHQGRPHERRPDIRPTSNASGPPTGPARAVGGTLEVDERGQGFVRDPQRNYAINPDDAWVPAELVRRYGLRGGEHVDGMAQGRPNGQPAVQLVSIERIEGEDPGAVAQIKAFEDLTVVDPRERVRFETPAGSPSMRVVDLLTPIGKGQRGLLVSPPRTGKTILLTQMASGIRANHPEMRLMMLLVDERPEEVTEMKRTIGAALPSDGAGSEAANVPEVVYSTNDKDVLSHVRLSRLMIARAKRQVERGREVVILLDSLTRLGRAFNAFVGSSGRTMTGGIDIRALTEPKAMFGAARNIEGGGSLTIIASALIETGSRMDDFIFQEFKGTGNMELVLTRELANLRIWPAIDIPQSGTRKEELLLPPDWLEKVYKLRRRLLGMRTPTQAMEQLLADMSGFKSNAEFIAAMRE